MKTKIKSKLMSILLVLVMVLSIVPFGALTAFAAEPTEIGSSASNPAMCYSYEEFKYAMESPNIRYVALGNVEDMLPLVSMSDASPYGDNRCPGIWVRGTKDLILMGNAQFTAPNATENVHRVYENLLLVQSGSRLTISGAGGLTFHGNAVGWPTSVIQVTTDGVLFVDGGTITGDTGNRTAFCYGINVNGGKLYVNGGTVVGTNRYDQAPISAILMYDGVANIYGGTFYSNVSDGAAGSKHYGLMIEENATCYLYGGGFKGISMPYASVMSDYIEDGYTLTVNGVKTDPAICGTTDGFVEVYQEISKINIHVNSPAAGKSPAMYPEDVYLVPEGVTVHDPVWYENGQPWNLNSGSERFEAGSTYTFEIVLTADDGVKFANPLTSATINYMNATVSAFAGNAENGVVLTVDLGECPNVVPQVDLTVTAPQEGNTLSYTVGCDSDAYYAVGGSSNYTDYRAWYESDTGYDNWREMSPGETFTSGKYYKLYVDIRTNEGYEFPLIDVGTIQPDVNAYINGYAANVIKAYDQDPSRYITVEYNFGECNDSVVENIIIENVTAPVAGEKPNYNWSIRGNGYQMDTSKNAYYDAYWKNPPEQWYYIKNGLGWFDVTDYDWVYENETFIAGHEYEVRVYVITGDGFEFAHNNYYEPTVTATVNRNTAEAIVDGSYCVTTQQIEYTFTCGAKTVDQVAITDLENPVGGNTPDTTVTVGDSDSYTVESVEWFDIEDNPAAETFESGVPYYALITVASATGAVFADAETIDVTVNGSELDSVEIKDGKLLVYVIIRKPASAPIVNPYVFTTQPTGGTVNAGESLNVAWQTSFIPTSTEIQYWDGEAWDQWDIQYPQNALDDYDFESHETASYRFRIVTYIGNDAVATSNEFVINWAEVAQEYIYVYTPGEGNGSNYSDYVTEGAQITLSTPESMGFSPIEGFAFDYWSIRKGTAQSAEVAQKQPGDTIIINDNTYIVAIWKEAPVNKYTVAYGIGEGSGSADSETDIAFGSSFTLKAFGDVGIIAPEGKEFDYWSVRTGSAMGTEMAQKQPGDTIIINDNTYIIAIWKAIPHTCVGVAESGQGATCTVDGWKDYYRCECGKYYEDANCQISIPDLDAWKVGAGKTTKDHEPNADDGDCTTAITCSVCGTVTTAANATHTAGADDGDCTTAIKCTQCDKNAVEANAAHTAGADDGDCTTAVKCTKCDKNAVEANATHTGGTATCTQKAECAVCGKEYGSFGDHNYGALIEAVAEKHTKTELAAGVAAHYQCSVCDKYFTSGKVETTLQALTGETPSHSYGDWQTNDDKHWKECSCGLKSEENDHVYDDATDVTCNICDHDRTLPHTHGNGVKQLGQSATCTTPGWNDYYKCSCGKLYTEADCTNEITDLEAWKTGAGKIEASHNYGTLVSAVTEKHTQTELVAGVAAHYHCSACGKYFTEGKVETTLEALTGTTPSHSYGDWKTDADKHWKECTCGKKADEGNHVDANSNNKCDTCDKTLSGGVTPPPHTHDYGTTWKSDGTNHWKECSCGDKKEVTAHSGGTATCEAKAKCSECNTEYGELAEHKYSEATCTAKAKCSVCGDEKGELAAHTYVDGKCACGATDPDYQPPHEHNFVEGKCECGETDPNYQPPHEHNFVEGKCECGETDPNYTPGTDTPGTDVPGTDVPGTDKPEDPDDGLSGGAIAGIVAGSVVVLGGGGFALFWFVIKKKSFADLIAVFKK